MELDLIKNEKFIIFQITHALPNLWKEILQNRLRSLFDKKNYQIFSLNKLNSIILYETLVDENITYLTNLI